ncbi:ATP-binding protein [Luteococcus sp. H138]|uniref:sensor histidine kinase n=1 Tax=unclassified Luteococcus TaxID=2639923 RepID=UPI00313F338B
MTVVWAGVGLLLGLVLGAAAMWLWHRSEERFAEIEQPVRTRPTVVEPQVVEVVNLLRSAAMVIGPHDEVLHSNPQARSLGMCRGDRILINKVLDEVRSVRFSEDPVVFDTEVSRGIGAPSLHLNVRIAPLGDTTLLVLADDRTALLRVDETRRDFVANVGHELKTPIGAVSLLAEAVESAADDADAVRRFSTRMQGEAARLGELVTQIIDLSRLQADDPMLRAEPVLIREVINQALQRSRELATKQAINLVRAGNEQLIVLGDEQQLVDAVANLVQNAMVYSDHGARVVITTNTIDEDGDDFVEISVADNGIGISPENQQRIFERFYRVDYGRSRENGGTGLGLSIVKHILAVHGGSVNVWSKLGQGSTFTVRLPLEPVATSQPPRAQDHEEDSERVS